jgi:ribonuclease BN (tRNA processing enzyme)
MPESHAAELPEFVEARRSAPSVNITVMHPRSSIGLITRGRSVVFSGDIDAYGLPALETIARGANLLVFDAVVLDPPGSPAVLYSLHSPPKAIGALAERSRVGALLLSHLSPAVDGSRAAVTASITRHYRGTVSFATDGLRLQP